MCYTTHDCAVVLKFVLGMVLDAHASKLPTIALIALIGNLRATGSIMRDITCIMFLLAVTRQQAHSCLELHKECQEYDALKFLAHTAGMSCFKQVWTICQACSHLSYA